MKAKRFKEFILESKEPNTKDDGIRWWFSEDSNMKDILGTGLWQLRIANRDRDRAVKVLQSFEWLLQTNLTPVIEKRSLWTTLWFRADRELDRGEIESAAETSRVNHRGQGLDIDCFQSSATGIMTILNLVDDNLTSNQLVELVEWTETNIEEYPEFGRDKLDAAYAKQIIQKIKAKPEWPEDMTDWALSDW
jgi:hypothetical protein